MQRPLSQAWFHALLSLYARLDEPDVQACVAEGLRHPGLGHSLEHTRGRTDLVKMVLERASPEVAYEILAKHHESADLVGVYADSRQVTLSERWLEYAFGTEARKPLSHIGGILDKFDKDQLAGFAGRLIELGLDRWIDPTHPGLRPVREAQLGATWEPVGVAKAAAYFVADPQRRPEVLARVIESSTKSTTSTNSSRSSLCSTAIAPSSATSI